MNTPSKTIAAQRPEATAERADARPGRSATAREAITKGPPRGVMAGWMAPDLADELARPFYPIASLRRKAVEIEVVLPHGEICRALIRNWPSPSSPLWWVRASGEQIGRYMTVIALSAVKWPHWHPVAWRPLDGATWPDPLPEALPQMRYVPPPLAEEDTPEWGEPVDGWPVPGLRLGKCTPPVSRAECEARVLRGIRTMNASGIVERDRPAGSNGSNAAVIERNAVFDVEGRQTARRRSVEHEQHMDRGHIPTVRSAWTPDRRDITDWDYALDWWRQLPDEQRDIIARRADNPVWSWRGIAERINRPQASVRFQYAKAVDRMFEISTANAAKPHEPTSA